MKVGVMPLFHRQSALYTTMVASPREVREPDIAERGNVILEQAVEFGVPPQLAVESPAEPLDPFTAALDLA